MYRKIRFKLPYYGTRRVSRWTRFWRWVFRLEERKRVTLHFADGGRPIVWETGADTFIHKHIPKLGSKLGGRRVINVQLDFFIIKRTKFI